MAAYRGRGFAQRSLRCLCYPPATHHRRSFVAVLAGLLVVEALAVGTLVERVAAAPSAATEVASGRSVVGVAIPIRRRESAQDRHLLVRIERALPITARPGGGRVVGTMPAGSRYYDIPTVAWVRDVSPDGRHGLVGVPYVARRVSGWIAMRGLDRSWTRVSVEADLSEHRITVRRGDDVLFRAPAATGAPRSPTPAGRYFVTDRVPFPNGGVLGTFAFGISGIQPNLPAGWNGGDQLAIHGTNDPSSIGTSSSAGCLRVSENVLTRLRRVLRLGTPVVVHA
jgi:lipoprotein-anchoring transpeptidase ErfK/SrfK